MGVASMIGPARAGTVPHGGRIEQARRRFPDAPNPFIDLSTGINPVPFPLPPLPATAFTRLPEPETLETLQLVAARAYGVADPAMVAAAPGTQVLIDLLPRLWPARQVAVLGPTYAEHAICWTRAGAEVCAITALEDAGEASVVVACNPNNPDGRKLSPSELMACADSLVPGHGLLVIDEAFCDFEPSCSLAPALPHPAIVILRSFGKTYGLAGLRLGFALAGPHRAEVIRAALGPWAVSGPALAIGCAALADAGWLAAARQRLVGDVERLDDCLSHAGLTLIGGTHLFRLAESRSAGVILDRLGRAGILVRGFDYRPDWLRFGLPGSEAEWTRLQAAL
jgi:cobalamin biosynthetic protein CobC